MNQENEEVIASAAFNPNDPSSLGGESKEGADLEKYVSKEMYQALETKLGEQGTELGSLRDLQKYFDEISPLLKKLDAEPKIVEAIMSDKIDSKLAESVLAGKVELEDATKVAEANTKVKNELGKEKYENLSTAQIEKLIMDKVEAAVSEKTKHFEGKVNQVEEKRNFEDDVKNFVKATKDFPEYASDVTKWFEEHPDQWDIEVAYNAVKGRAWSAKASKENELLEAEEAKKLAANAGGGSSQGRSIAENKVLIDELVGNNANPNSF